MNFKCSHAIFFFFVAYSPSLIFTPFNKPFYPFPTLYFFSLLSMGVGGGEMNLESLGEEKLRKKRAKCEILISSKIRFLKKPTTTD